MMTENLLLFIFLVLLPQICRCINSPPTCGVIRNISFPFRLKNDPKNWGDPRYELECENNDTAIIYLDSRKYKVKAIDYDNHTLRLAYAFVNNNTCSFPNFSFGKLPFGYSFLQDAEYGFLAQNRPIRIMSCPYPLKNSSLFTQIPTHCEASYSSTHTYIMVGFNKVSDVRDNCTVNLIGPTSWNFTRLENVSLSEIHDSLLYGFQLNWTYFNCKLCNGNIKCAVNGDVDTLTCSLLSELWDNVRYPGYGPNGSGPFAAVFLILLLLIVAVFAGVGLMAKIIIAITCAFGFIIIEMYQGSKGLNTYWPVAHFRLIIGVFFAVRVITTLPCIIGFLNYKFKKRHLSRFAEIEEFLQSDNQLMPIRYSYSDIKKLTKGFREKLGQGGFGTVYKGRLRSGYDVAVKLLGKPGGNGQDFMNEIATIGRIHHLNVVKLVGYCAERSKRALVFDYMSNGSLDKHIYDGEKSNRLSWERKYSIAIGVARGIEYLHRGCNIQILHFDIKPHNILLDDNFTPKITDFGLAKFFSTDKTVVTMTAIRGTIGYVAPELINRGFGEVSYKADVYSFGMLLMEMVGLNRDSNGNNQASSQYFPCWIYDLFEQGQDIDFGFTNENNDANRQIAKKMAIVALWCIQMSPGDRPSMNKVVEMLEASVERLRVPNRPYQSVQVAVNYGDQSWSTYSIDDSTSLLGQDAAPSPSIEITVED